MVSGQWMLSILHRQLFINSCTFLMIVGLVLQVSAPYCRIVLTFVLKILTLILVESCFEFHMFFNCRNAALALLVLAFASASDPPSASMMLPPKYVKDSTPSRVSPSGVMRLVFSVLYLRTLVRLLPYKLSSSAFVCVYGIGGLGHLRSPNRLIDSELFIVFLVFPLISRSS
ncbi:unnamed protein product [Schistosoma curassoni]|uniref:Secreted protein n=1 Tax=Schistosoma curassoni TaxID=6186 RepID=A0A183KKS6_9TREM|nr:unnamed protein product [Schistosoma curassoni]